MIERLLEAYATLMSRAPGAAFRKARALYLNKYSLPQADEQTPFKLFVCDEQLTETVEPIDSGDPQERLVTLRSTPGALALVHWQQNCPAPDDLVRQRRGMTNMLMLPRSEENTSDASSTVLMSS